MWEMYDKLIREIPEDLIVDDYVTGGHFAFLRSGDLCGVAHNTRGESRPRLLPEDPRGLPLKRVAQAAKSWNMQEATMGMAAINAFYNTKANLESFGKTFTVTDRTSRKERKAKNPLNDHPEALRGKKVALIGHFRGVEKKLEGFADMYILERNPQEGDYPDSACEYLLADMDFVYATGMTLINKTLKRLLELKGAHTRFTLMGPTATISPLLFSYGVDSIASYIVTDPDFVRDVIARDVHGMFSGGMMVELCREDLDSLRKSD